MVGTAETQNSILYCLCDFILSASQNALSKHGTPTSADNTNWNDLLPPSIQTLELVIALIISISQHCLCFLLRAYQTLTFSILSYRKDFYQWWGFDTKKVILFLFIFLWCSVPLCNEHLNSLKYRQMKIISRITMSSLFLLFR